MTRIKPQPAPRFCRDCFTDISHRAAKAFRCEDCAAKEKLLRRHQDYLTRILKKQEKAMERCSRGQGLEYSFQRNSSDGSYYEITSDTSNNCHIPKVCAGCHRDDSQVRGQWGPIFTRPGAHGDDVRPTLLCLTCYETECEKDWGEASWLLEKVAG
jgi:hypothetical protein